MGNNQGMRWSSWRLVVVVWCVASAFVALRWAVAADRDLSCFALVGSAYADDPSVCVQPGTGYDGQFSYRLAVDPTSLSGTAGGVTLDSPLRLQRVLYPWLAHAVALGQDRYVPVALVLVNVLAAGALAALGIALARRAGRPAAAGLLPVAFFGFVTTIGRDLTELVTATALVGAVVAWERDRRWTAAAALAAAALSRESAYLLAMAFALGELLRHRSWRGVAPLIALPTAAFVSWQAVATAATGAVPLLTSQDKNMVFPLSDLLPAAARWAAHAADLDRQGLIDLGQLVVLAVVVALAGRVAFRQRDGLALAWLASLGLVLSLSANVWKGPADFRTAGELWALSCLLLLRGRTDLRWPALLAAAAWVGTAAFRATSL